MNITKLLLFICIFSTGVQNAWAGAAFSSPFDGIDQAPQEEGKRHAAAARAELDHADQLAQVQAGHVQLPQPNQQTSLLRRAFNQVKSGLTWSKERIGSGLTWTAGKAREKLSQISLRNIGQFSWDHKSQIVKLGLPLYVAYQSGILGGVCSGLWGKPIVGPVTMVTSLGKPSEEQLQFSIPGRLAYEITAALLRARRAADPSGYYTTTGLLGLSGYFYLQYNWNNYYKKEIVRVYETHVRPLSTAASIFGCLWVAKKITDQIPFRQ